MLATAATAVVARLVSLGALVAVCAMAAPILPASLHTTLTNTLTNHTNTTAADNPDQVWPFPSPDPDVGKGMEAIVQERGFPLETHWVTTADGYILTLFRIPHAPGTTHVGPPVLLQHCLLCSSFDFVNNMATESLAFRLAASGLDVWLGNNRGNTYAKNHTTLDVNSDAFWDFSWDEMARYDLPAIVDYVRNATDTAAIPYVGHSEGTTQAFAAFSRDPDLASKVSQFVALAPIARIAHSGSPVFNLMAELGVASLFQFFGVQQFLPSSSVLSWFAPWLCKTVPGGCDSAIFLFCGETTHLNATRLQVYTSQTPAGTSVRNMAHWAQLINNDRFGMYDFGEAENMKRYNQSTPPDYDLTQVKVPTALFVGNNDILVDPTDLQWLLSVLPNTTVAHFSRQTDWAHLDYAWAFDGQDVFDEVGKLVWDAHRAR